ncbi:MAG: protein-ADP-ribose hydrolase [Clostridiales bacterium]|nr:protein-ADP-ribose hydrolase [Clostridiales bacterium]
MEQNERLDYLVKRFLDDSGRYKGMEVADDPAEKRTVLRSLMNIRMPGLLDEESLRIQDEYLKARIAENGIVETDALPTAADLGSTAANAEQIIIWQGDITRLACDAIVNAANSQMLGCFVPMHTCIDNCIHTFAGIQLRAACDEQMRALRAKYGQDYEQPTAVPMLTEGYNLPAKYVIHIVGPIVQGALTERHEEELAACYRNTLDLCAEEGIRSVSFCCLSTGVFRFPNKRAAMIAVKTVQDWLEMHPGSVDRVIFNVFKDEDLEYYEQQLV